MKNTAESQCSQGIIRWLFNANTVLRKYAMSSIKIQRLTADQKAQMAIYRDRWLQIGLSTEPANRKAAETAIMQAYAVAGLKAPALVWCGSPLSQGLTRAIVLYVQFRDSVGASVRDSVWASVRDGVWAGVGASVGDSVWDSVGASVRDSVWDSVWDSVRASVRDSVGASVWASVWDSVRASVRDSVWASVWDSVGPSVGASVRDSG